MKATIKGTLHLKGETVQASEKFSKRDAVILVEDGHYKHHIQIQFQQKSTALLDDYKVGDVVECQVNITGREWTNKEGKTSYFNTLVCWAIKAERKPSDSPNIQPQATKDDLPF